MASEKYSGVQIFFNGKRHIVPALSLKQMVEFKDLLSETKKEDEAPEEPTMFVERRIAMVLAALQRNYPEMNSENVRDYLDMNNIREVALAIQGAAPSALIVEPQSDAA